RQPKPVLLRPAGWTVLRLQPAGGEALTGGHLELVAPGHDGRRQGPLRRHRRLLADGLHPGSAEDHRAGPGDARRRRPDRAVRGLGAALGQAAEEWDAEDLQGFSARHAHDRGGGHQRRSAGVPDSLRLMPTQQGLLDSPQEPLDLIFLNAATQRGEALQRALQRLAEAATGAMEQHVVSGLTVTIGFGHAFMNTRAPSRRPKGLRAMPQVKGDEYDPATTH